MGIGKVEMHPEDSCKTVFVTKRGPFEFQVIGFGLTKAPSSFQRLMDLVLADLQWTTCLVYLDDIVVFGRTFQEDVKRLDEVFTRLEQAGLRW